MEIYNSPESFIDRSKEKPIHQRLLEEQRPFWGMLAALFGFEVGNIILSYGPTELVPTFVFVLPGILAGIALKLVGRPISIKHRLIPSLFFGILFFSTYVYTNTFIAILLSIANAGLCWLISKRLLDYDEEKALFNKKINLRPQQA